MTTIENYTGKYYKLILENSFTLVQINRSEKKGKSIILGYNMLEVTDYQKVSFSVNCTKDSTFLSKDSYIEITKEEWGAEIRYYFRTITKNAGIC